ncbi:MAG: hypothetical protein ACOYUZ_01800 [Patescibacteria group bacterium]
MARIVFKAGTLTVGRYAAGERLFVRRKNLKNVDDFATVEELDDADMLTFKADCIVVMDRMHDNRRTCTHLRYCRLERDAGGLHFAKPVEFPRLVAALKHAGRSAELAIGGFASHVVIYGDEVAVATHKDHWGFVVRREEIEGLLKALPPKAEKAEKAA